jgi:Zn-finger nucleic acid-binding protein
VSDGAASEQLPCPHCEAPASPTANDCPACSLPLVRAVCPGCYDARFLWSKGCRRCGSTVEAIEDVLVARPCPGCAGTLARHRVGEVESWLCAACEGRWLDRPWIDRLLADRERQASLLWNSEPVPPVDEPPAPSRRCPSCKGELARLHFATGSEVLIDLCQPHGIWFDRDELARVARFMLEGRVDARPSRKEPQQARQQPAAPPPPPQRPSDVLDDAGDVVDELLRFLVS